MHPKWVLFKVKHDPNANRGSDAENGLVRIDIQAVSSHYISKLKVETQCNQMF